MKITIELTVEEFERLFGEKTKETKETKVEPKEEMNYKPAFSKYARVFDESSVEWVNDAEFNKMLLMHKERLANDLLKAQGHLFLNEVYSMLGFPKTKAGQVVGWVYNEKKPYGDNFVDFDITNDYNRDFINGCCNKVLLDFNVDGVIIDKI